MKAQLKCSNCGAEISNLNMAWGQKQWLWFIPAILLVVGMPFWMDFLLKETQDFRADLSIKGFEKRYVDGTIDILGVVENQGTVNWEHIVIEAELYAKDGTFLDELSGHIPGSLSPGASERFKISSKEFSESRWESITDMTVKESDAFHSKFSS